MHVIVAAHEMIRRKEYEIGNKSKIGINIFLAVEKPR
jgi:hypothetical protein